MDEELGADALAVEAFVEGELGEEDRRDLLGCPAADTTVRGVALDEVRRSRRSGDGLRGDLD